MDLPDYFNTSQPWKTDGFSPPVAALLSYADAEDYVPFFREHNIGAKDLPELGDTDLIIMGVNSAKVRHDLIETIKQLPESAQSNRIQEFQLKVSDVMNILIDSGMHLNRVCASLATTKVLVRKYSPEDVIICQPNIYATDIIIKSLDRLELLSTSLQKELKALKIVAFSVNNRKKNNKKIVIATLGGITIATLSFCLFKSLQNLR